MCAWFGLHDFLPVHGRNVDDVYDARVADGDV